MTARLSVADAWSALGENPEGVMGEIRAFPDIASRVKAAEAALARAERIGKALMLAHHPDKNLGDPSASARFRRVGDALDSIRFHTGEFIKKAEDPDREEKSPIIVFK